MSSALKAGQTLVRPWFNELTRIETVQPSGTASWGVGLVSTGRRGARQRGTAAATAITDESLTTLPRRLRSTGSTPPCCCSPAAAPTRCALLSAEQERGPDFLRLANALAALYPRAARRSAC
jgi:hypothetical protein